MRAAGCAFADAPDLTMVTRYRDKKRAMLPKGVATYLPQAARLKHRIEESILDVFQQWGYQEVVPPIFEYLDVITHGLGEDLAERGYKLVDRGSGRMILLRPDVTPQIARMVATLMADLPRPLRLCYRANVFRHEDEHGGRARELFQVGGELVGLEGPEADAEIVAIGIESLRRLGLSDFTVALGQIEVFRALMGLLAAPPERERRIKDAVARKDLPRLEQLLRAETAAPRLVEALLSVPRLFGRERVLDEAERLALCAPASAALERLRQVHALLVAAGYGDVLVIDLGDLRGFDYYTGILFELFSRDLGVPLGRGGRYDNLIGKFGLPAPSTGFALDVEHVQRALEGRNGLAEAAAADLVLAGGAGGAQAFALAQQLRSEGLRVARAGAAAEAPELLRLAQSQSIPFVALLEGGRARVIRVRDGLERSVAAKQLAATVTALR